MWNDDIDMPSVDEPSQDWVIPEFDEAWAEWWFINTFNAKGLRYWQAYGGRESLPFRDFVNVEADAA
jgi:hypothetical protein